MYITYHVEVPNTKGIRTLVHHDLLNDEIKKFLEANANKQTVYVHHFNEYCSFLYLDNGDRIDIQH